MYGALPRTSWIPGLDERTRPWWTLIGACAGLFLLMLDSTVVTLALPSIDADLDSSAVELQWIVNGYLLTIAVLVVTLGRLGDIFGRRRMYVVGLLVFGAGSVLSAISWTEEMLIAGRILQGVGGAALLPLSLALVAAAFAKPDQPRAFGIWAAASAVALGLGPVFGGLLVDVSWRLIFWINLPLVALGIAIALKATRETRDETSGTRIDVPGLIALTVGLTAAVLALIQADTWGWDSARTIVVLAAGLVGLVVFWFVEHRVADPIVDFSLFRNGPYFGATAAAFGIVFAYWTVIFFQPQFLQTQLDYSSPTAGLLILPITAPIIVISPLSGTLIARFGARALMTFGVTLSVVGLVILTRIDGATEYVDMLPGFLLFGIGLGLVYAPMSAAAMAAMPAEKAGIASGVLAMNRILAGAIGLAVTNAVFDQLLASSDAPEKDAYATALGDSYWILVGVGLVAAVLTWAFVRSAPPPPPPVDQHRVHHRRFHF